MILSFEFSKKDVRFLDPREDGSEFDSWENPLSALTPFLSPPQDSNLDVDWLETTLRSIDHPIDDSPLIQPDDNIRDIIRCFLPLFSNIRKRERERVRETSCCTRRPGLYVSSRSHRSCCKGFPQLWSTGCRFRSSLSERDSNSWRIDKWLFCFYIVLRYCFVFDKRVFVIITKFLNSKFKWI